MFDSPRLTIFIYDESIVVENKRGRQKQFPRCGITNVEQFIFDMAKHGKLDELLVE